MIISILTQSQAHVFFWQQSPEPIGKFYINPRFFLVRPLFFDSSPTV